MARNVIIGQKVYVPATKFEELKNHPSAFYETTVQSINNRTISVSLPCGVIGEISLQFCRTEIGIAIFNIGDLETEETLLDPLHKSTLQYCRLLVPDDCVFSWKIRSLKELESIWGKHHRIISTVVVIAHGSEDSIKFANDGWVTSGQFKDVINIRGADRKVFIFLSCNAGYKAFGGKFSKMSNCSEFIGPFHNVHGADASLFCQSFFRDYVVSGHTVKTAFNHARDVLRPKVSFRLWRNGVLQADN